MKKCRYYIQHFCCSFLKYSPLYHMSFLLTRRKNLHIKVISHYIFLTIHFQHWYKLDRNTWKDLTASNLFNSDLSGHWHQYTVKRECVCVWMKKFISTPSLISLFVQIISLYYIEFKMKMVQQLVQKSFSNKIFTSSVLYIIPFPINSYLCITKNRSHFKNWKETKNNFKGDEQKEDTTNNVKRTFFF